MCSYRIDLQHARGRQQSLHRRLVHPNSARVAELDALLDGLLVQLVQCDFRFSTGKIIQKGEGDK